MFCWTTDVEFLASHWRPNGRTYSKQVEALCRHHRLYSQLDTLPSSFESRSDHCCTGNTKCLVDINYYEPYHIEAYLRQKNSTWMFCRKFHVECFAPRRPLYDKTYSEQVNLFISSPSTVIKLWYIPKFVLRICTVAVVFANIITSCCVPWLRETMEPFTIRIENLSSRVCRCAIILQYVGNLEYEKIVVPYPILVDYWYHYGLWVYCRNLHKPCAIIVESWLSFRNSFALRSEPL